MSGNHWEKRFRVKRGFCDEKNKNYNYYIYRRYYDYINVYIYSFVLKYIREDIFKLTSDDKEAQDYSIAKLYVMGY